MTIKEILIEMAKQQVEQDKLEPMQFIEFTRYLDTLSESNLATLAELAVIEAEIENEDMAIDDKEITDRVNECGECDKHNENFQDIGDERTETENEEIDEGLIGRAVNVVKPIVKPALNVVHSTDPLLGMMHRAITRPKV